MGKFDCDVILAPEAMGIPLTVPISLRTRIPYSVIRKREYRLPGEISVQRGTGYSSGFLYINGLKKGDKVTIVDDVPVPAVRLKRYVRHWRKRNRIKRAYHGFRQDRISVTIDGMEIGVCSA